MGIVLCSNLLFGQNSLSLDFFKRINTWAGPGNLTDFSKGPNEFIFCGTLDTTASAFTGCANNGLRHGILVLTDESANIKWARCYGVTGGFSNVGFGKDQTIWAAGQIDSIEGARLIDSNSVGLTVVKCDSSGNALWYNKYGAPGDCELSDFIATSDGGSLILEKFNTVGGDIAYRYGSNPLSYNGWLCKIDSAGGIEWSVVLGGSGDQSPAKVKELEPNIYTVLINTSSVDYMLTGLNPDSNVSPWFIKFDLGGHILSSKVIEVAQDTIPDYKDFVFPNPNSIILAGNETTLTNNTFCAPTGNLGNFEVVDADSSYNAQWCAVNGGGFDFLNYACGINDSLIVAGGYSQAIVGDLSACISYSAFDFHAWFGLYCLNQHKKIWQEAFCGSGDDWINGMLYDSIENALYVLEFSTDTDDNFGGQGFPNTGNTYLLKYTPVTTGINDIANEDSQIKLYPNPANDLCNLQITGGNKVFSASIFDVTGREIKTLFSNQLVADFSFSVENLLSGIYFLRVSDEQGNGVVKKLVVQR